MLDIARRRNPEVTFHQGDMATFQLGATFQAVVCLFSSIGYVQTVERMNQTLRRFASHTAPGGVVVVDSWITPDRWKRSHLQALLVDETDLKLARLSRSDQDGMLSILELHHLVVTAAGAESFVERHEMGLFTPEQYRAAFEEAGLTVTYDPHGGPLGREVYVGLRPVT